MEELIRQGSEVPFGYTAVTELNGKNRNLQGGSGFAIFVHVEESIRLNQSASISYSSASMYGPHHSR